MSRDPVTVALAVILAVTVLAWLFAALIRALVRREVHRVMRTYIVAAVIRPRDKRGRFKRV